MNLRIGEHLNILINRNLSKPIKPRRISENLTNTTALPKTDHFPDWPDVRFGWQKTNSFIKHYTDPSGIFELCNAFVSLQINQTCQTGFSIELIDGTGRLLDYPFQRTYCFDNVKEKINLYRKKIFTKKKEEKNKSILILGTQASGNYFHFLVEVIGDIFFLRKNGIEPNIFDFIYITPKIEPWAAELLVAANIDLNRIRCAPISLGPVDIMLVVRPKGNALYVQDFIADGIREVLQFNPERVNEKDVLRVAIDRGVNSRGIGNNQTYKSLLKKYDFHLITLDKLKVRQQMEIFNKASVVIGEHGAGLTNLIWCRRGTTVLDIHTLTPPRPCFAILAAQVGLSYVPIFECRDDSVTMDILNTKLSNLF